MRPHHLVTVFGFGAALVASGAHAQTPDDPYERMNRRFYASATYADRRFFLPLARFYHLLTPGPIGIAIHNMVTNLSEPVIVANDILQFRGRAAGRDFVRLAANTTAGIGGMIDVAAPQGLPHHDNDFGITLGVWGLRPGPYLFLPFLGPSTVRDAIGMAGDAAMNPLNYVRFPGRLTLEVSSGVVGGLDKRLSSQADLDALTGDATDPYATLRSVYLQSREAAVRGEDAPPVLPPIDEPEPSVAPTSSAAPEPGADAAPISTAAPAAPSAIDAPVAQEAAASNLDGPIATAFPCDTAQAAPRFLAAN